MQVNTMSTDMLQAPVEEIVVHKFRTLTPYFWGALERSELYFPAPHQLNDPYDCQIDLVKAFTLVRGEHQLTAWLPHARKIMEISAATGVLSFSVGDLTDSSLMWSHYAGNHAGVCLTYRIPQTFVTGQLVGQTPVHYGEEVLLSAIRDLNLDRVLDFPSLEPVIKAYLATKASPWAYEKEGRLIAFDPGCIAVSKDYLQQVCFGMRTPAQDRERVAVALTRYGYSNCQTAEVFHSAQGLFALDVRTV